LVVLRTESRVLCSTTEVHLSLNFFTLPQTELRALHLGKLNFLQDSGKKNFHVPVKQHFTIAVLRIVFPRIIILLQIQVWNNMFTETYYTKRLPSTTG
jgi:hypothetical protein